MTAPGIAVRARPGYVANEVLAPAALASAPPSPAALAVEAALGALGRARPTSELTTSAVVDGLEIATVVDLGARFTANGWSNGAAVDVEIIAADGSRAGVASGRIEPGQPSVVLRAPLGASTGPWRVTTRVTGLRPVQDSVMATATTSVILGDPLVYRATPSMRSAAHVVANLLFSRAERLRVVWPVVDTPDSTAVRLLDRLGKPLGGPLPAAIDRDGDRPALSVDLVLGPLSEGDYLVEVEARRGAVVERKLQAFRVVR
jgi:hypothetical protein